MGGSTFSLTLYFYPSPLGLDWSSPRSITWSVLKNQFSGQNRKIGHVHVELKGESQHSGYPVHLITGMAQKNKLEEKRLLFWDHIGLGILFHCFQGALEGHQRSHEEIISRAKKGSLSFLKILLSRESYLRAHQFLADYKKHGHDQYYGLPNNPLKAEGGGCTAFGVSFLDVAGVMEEEFKKHWTRFLRVPKKILGGKHNDTIPHKKVSFFELLFEKAGWASDNEPHREIFFWDAERMHEWVIGIHNGKIKSSLSNLRFDKLHNALGIIMDRIEVVPSKEPNWKK